MLWTWKATQAAGNAASSRVTRMVAWWTQATRNAEPTAADRAVAHVVEYQADRLLRTGVAALNARHVPASVFFRDPVHSLSVLNSLIAVNPPPLQLAMQSVQPGLGVVRCSRKPSICSRATAAQRRKTVEDAPGGQWRLPLKHARSDIGHVFTDVGFIAAGVPPQMTQIWASSLRKQKRAKT